MAKIHANHTRKRWVWSLLYATTAPTAIEMPTIAGQYQGRTFRSAVQAIPIHYQERDPRTGPPIWPGCIIFPRPFKRPLALQLPEFRGYHASTLTGRSSKPPTHQIFAGGVTLSDSSVIEPSCRSRLLATCRNRRFPALCAFPSPTSRRGDPKAAQKAILAHRTVYRMTGLPTRCRAT